jgi:hypothetical protein
MQMLNTFFLTLGFKLTSSVFQILPSSISEMSTTFTPYIVQTVCIHGLDSTTTVMSSTSFYLIIFNNLQQTMVYAALTHNYPLFG